MSVLSRAVAAIVLACWAVLAIAASSFQIESIYSNADGAVQYVVLHESAGSDGQQALTGSTLTLTYAGRVKTFTFPADLPSGATANRRVLIASQGFAALGIIAPDYVFPDQFIATDGGTLAFAGVDQVAYAALPTDGVTAIDRNGAPVQDIAANFAGASASIPPVPVTVIEYYDAVRDHYFMTALAPEIDALDQQIIPGWARTGQSFEAYATVDSGGPGAQPVCRFYIPPQSGNSHFFSASVAECTAVLQLTQTNPAFAGYIYETPDAFFIGLPDLVTGACPLATIPVYRLWNQRPDSNHRYTIDPAIKAQMIAQGFVPEGYGPGAVAMCAPATGPVDLTNVNFNGVAWTGTLFVAVAGARDGQGVVAVSPDGLAWSVRSSGTPTLRAIAWTGSQLVAVGVGGTIVTSPDGYRWTPQRSNASESFSGVAASDDLVMAVGDSGAVFSSPDGVSWARRSSKTTENLNAIVWIGGKFVFVGDNGAVGTMPEVGSANIHVSGTAENLAGIAVNAAGKLATIGTNGVILTSPDGITWTPRVSNTGASLLAIVAAGNQFITVGAGGRIVVSSSGNTWNVAQSKTASTLAGITWSGAQFVAVGASGAVATSTDGVTWSSQ